MSRLPIVIKFFSPVIDVSVNALMDIFDKKMRQGQREFILLISSPGGSVFHGLSAYNYLKGIPADIITHNFGSVDSIGVTLYCGGEK
jgi:ATP-dependent Clp protease protease subunit